MPVGVTELSRRIHALHMLIFWVCVVIAAAVFGAMIYSIVKFRRSQGAVAASFDHSTRAEIVWTVIPIVILVAMAIPAAATLVRIEDTRNSELTIKVTGYQWRWHYEYLDRNVAFFSIAGPRERRRAAARFRRRSQHGAQLPAGRRPSAGRAGRQEGARAADCRRRHPCLVGAVVRHEEGRDPGLRQRAVVPRRPDRHLSRPVRGAVRPRSRLHAGGRRRPVGGGLRQLAEGAAGRAPRQRTQRPNTARGRSKSS